MARFTKGQSGNPSGKPKGATHRTTRLIEELMEKGTRSVVETMLNLAKKGDVGAGRLILERVLPARRTPRVEFALPEGDPVAAISAVLGAVAAGNLTPDEGTSITAMLEARRRMVETAVLEERLDAVEKVLAERVR